MKSGLSCQLSVVSMGGLRPSTMVKNHPHLRGEIKGGVSLASSDKGFTLAEITVTIVLVAVLGLGFMLAMMEFVIGYQESQDFMRLQQEMINLVNAIRYGVLIDGIHNTDLSAAPAIGLLTAQLVTINLTSDMLIMTPVGGQSMMNRQMAVVRWDRNEGTVWYDAQFGSQYEQVQIFPREHWTKVPRERIGRDNRFRITNLFFENLSPYAEQPQLVKVTVEGQVRHRERFRGRGVNQTVEEDRTRNIKRIVFESTVYVGNSDKIAE